MCEWRVNVGCWHDFLLKDCPEQTQSQHCAGWTWCFAEFAFEHFRKILACPKPYCNRCASRFGPQDRAWQQKINIQYMTLASKHAEKFLEGLGFNHHGAEVMASIVSQLVDAMTLCSQPEPVERQVRTTIDPPVAPEEAMKLLKDRAPEEGRLGQLEGPGRVRKGVDERSSNLVFGFVWFGLVWFGLVWGDSRLIPQTVWSDLGFLRQELRPAVHSRWSPAGPANLVTPTAQKFLDLPFSRTKWCSRTPFFRSLVLLAYGARFLTYVQFSLQAWGSRGILMTDMTGRKISVTFFSFTWQAWRFLHLDKTLAGVGRNEIWFRRFSAVFFNGTGSIADLGRCFPKARKSLFVKLLSCLIWKTSFCVAGAVIVFVNFCGVGVGRLAWWEIFGTVQGVSCTVRTSWDWNLWCSTAYRIYWKMIEHAWCKSQHWCAVRCHWCDTENDQQRSNRQEGNRRFVNGCPWGSKTKSAARQQLVEDGQAPHTAIIGCADSRAPLETIFDTMPGTATWFQRFPSPRPATSSAVWSYYAILIDFHGVSPKRTGTSSGSSFVFGTLWFHAIHRMMS